jgi:hypothetical protein
MLYRRAFDYFSWVSGRSHDRDENHSVVFEVSNGAKRNVPKGETSKCALPFVRDMGEDILDWHDLRGLDLRLGFN